jgi:hypothetical protein
MQSGSNQPFDSNNLIQGLQQLTRLSLSSIKTMIDSNTRVMNEAGGVLSSIGLNPSAAKKKDCNCCPPKEDCPPHCLLIIARSAHPGERILVPFSIRNYCGGPKRYRVGVRPLMDRQGNPAPSQPQLDKTEVNLQQNQAITVVMAIDLSQGYQPGNSYETEIVIREQDINQNICFRLDVESFIDVPEARPLDEKKYGSHFQSWQSHYYCEPKKQRRDAIITPVND